MSADINIYRRKHLAGFRPLLLWGKPKPKASRDHNEDDVYSLWNWLSNFSECGRSRKPEAKAIHFLIGTHGPH